MSKDSGKFTVEDYDRLIDDIMDEFFEQQNVNYDLKELLEAQGLGTTGETNPMEGFTGGQ